MHIQYIFPKIPESLFCRQLQGFSTKTLLQAFTRYIGNYYKESIPIHGDLFLPQKESARKVNSPYRKAC